MGDPTLNYATVCPEHCTLIDEVWRLFIHLQEVHGWGKAELEQWYNRLKKGE
jgi:hypothetical protein